jgi:pimeloyl-ACP methyl ester carboxylesterase
MTLAGCTEHDVPSSELDPPRRSATILVPGYYGSRLVQSTDGKLIWISATQALFGSQPLTLPIEGLGLPDTVDLRADGILDHVQVVPLLYAVDGYGSILKAIQDQSDGHSTVVALSYDWRDDLLRTVRTLDGTIRRLRAEGATDIQVVAHSMGGLIAAYYLRYGVQEPDEAVETWAGAAQVDRVVLAGVPFKGTMIAFRNSQYGVKIGLNRTLLQPIAVSSFPATYYLLPAQEQDVLLTPDLVPIAGGVRDANNWMTQRWGLLNPSGLPNDIASRRQAYTTTWLARTQTFSNLLLAPSQTSDPSPVSVLSIVGTGEDTLATGVWDATRREDDPSLVFDTGAKSRTGATLDKAVLFKDGDGSVTTESATLPKAYRASLRTTVRSFPVGHAEMMTRGDVQQTIIEFLHRGRSAS